MLLSRLLAAFSLAITSTAAIPSSKRFDLTKPSYDLWRNKKLADTTVHQSFTFDQTNKRLFVAQRRDGADTTSGDLTITQLDFDGNIKGSMSILSAGHGVNIGAEPSGEDTFLWTEIDAADSGYGSALTRFKFEDGRTIDDSDGALPRIKPIPDMDRGTCTFDALNNRLITRYQRSSKQNIAVFDFAKFNETDHTFDAPLADWPIPALNGITDVFQGYAAYGRYVYFLLGESYEASGGELNSEVISLDLETGEIVQGPVLTKAGSTLVFREPEGMGVYRTDGGEVRLFLGMASGEAGDRRINLFYKNALI